MARTIRKINPTKLQIPKRERVAAYARVSMEKDTMLHSLSAQVSHYSDYIQHNPAWIYAGVYADNACTGTRADRPEFQRLMADCRAGKIDRIITKSISRFARNTVTLLEVTRELKELGIDVYFEKENMHSTSGDGELMLSLLASFAQEESRSVSENCKWRIQNKFKAGIPTTTRINGYHMDHGKISIIPDEAETVKLIFALRRLGYGRLAICKELNARGIPAKNGGEWKEGSITKILQNEKYVGDLLLQKQFRVDHLEKKDKKNEGELPQWFIPDNHEAIISRETFDAVQADIKRRAAALPVGHGRHIVYPFSKKLICAHCGKNYRRRYNTGIAAWQCNTFMTYGRDKCPARQVREEILENCCARVMGLDQFDPDLFSAMVDHITVCDNQKLIVSFRDGRTEDVYWEVPSRADSWTTEMRAEAANRQRRHSHE